MVPTYYSVGKVVYGLKYYIRKLNVIEDEVCDRIVDPAEIVSHRNINMGTTLILSNSGRCLRLQSLDML